MIKYTGDYSKDRFLYRCSYHLVPMLEKIFSFTVKKDKASEASKELTIDDDNNFCINGIPVGDYREIANFKVFDSNTLRFQYGKKFRDVEFGVFPFLEVGNEVCFVLEFYLDRFGNSSSEVVIYQMGLNND